MRLAANILGVCFLLAGGIFFLQGINVLPGSFMTGQIRWAINGGIGMVLGVILLLVGNLRRKSPPKG